MLVSSLTLGNGTSLQKKSAIAKIGRAAGVFGDDLRFSVLTGSAAQNKEKEGSDLDILTVVDGQAATLVDATLEFTRAQVLVQIEFGFSPDYTYPSDVITGEQLQAVTDGCAIRRQADEFSLVPTDAPDEQLDYRIWLYELISHDFCLVAGDPKQLMESTRRALALTFMLAVADGSISNKANIDDLLVGIYGPAGIKKFITGQMCEVLLLEVADSDLAVNIRGRLDFDLSYIKEKLLQRIRPVSDLPYIVPWQRLREFARSL